MLAGRCSVQMSTWCAWYCHAKDLKISPDYAIRSEKYPFSPGVLSLKHSSVFQIWSFVGLLSFLLGQ